MHVIGSFSLNVKGDLNSFNKVYVLGKISQMISLGPLYINRLNPALYTVLEFTKDWFIYLYIVYDPAQDFFTQVETSSLSRNRCKIHTYSTAPPSPN